MPSEYLFSTLLQAIRDIGQLPPSDEDASEVALLAMANREQRTYLMRLLLSVREAYQLDSVEVALDQTTLAARIPSRAVGSGLHRVEAFSGTQIWPLDPWPEERTAERAIYSGPGEYKLVGNRVILFAPNVQATSLRLYYFRRFNKLVAEDETAEVASFDAGAKTVTLVSVPTGWSGTFDVDVVQGSPGFDVLGSEMEAALSGSVLTFTDDLPDDLAAGDYIALPGETPVCQAPLELHDVLAQRVAFKWLEAKGDPKAGAAKAALDELRQDALSLLAPRVGTDQKPIVNFAAPGWSRWNRHWRRFFR